MLEVAARLAGQEGLLPVGAVEAEEYVHRAPQPSPQLLLPPPPPTRRGLHRRLHRRALVPLAPRLLLLLLLLQRLRVLSWLSLRLLWRCWRCCGSRCGEYALRQHIYQGRRPLLLRARARGSARLIPRPRWALGCRRVLSSRSTAVLPSIAH